MTDPLYRARQFLNALRARPVDGQGLELARRYLPPRAAALFEAMSPADQAHSLAVLQALLDRGYRDRPLLQAALLHDVAKARIGIWHRTAVILLNAVSPDLVRRAASPDEQSWRYPFYLSVHHPALGAELAERAGLDPGAVLLIRRHQDPLPADGPDDEQKTWQKALKAVDDRN